MGPAAHPTRSVSVTLPLKFGRPSGFAFVNYKTEAQANEAVEKLNDGGE